MSESPLTPGICVGELALLLEQPRSATVRVVIDAELLALHRRDAEDLLGRFTEGKAAGMDRNMHSSLARLRAARSCHSFACIGRAVSR